MRDFIHRIWATLKWPLTKMQARKLAQDTGGLNQVVKTTDNDFNLICVLCPNVAERAYVIDNAVTFTRCTGAVNAPYFPEERAQEFFEVLTKKGASALCEHVEEEEKGNVIGYCPKCRALYCSSHYTTHETWSGSWLESLHGTCPRGHRREIA